MSVSIPSNTKPAGHYDPTSDGAFNRVHGSLVISGDDVDVLFQGDIAMDSGKIHSTGGNGVEIDLEHGGVLRGTFDPATNHLTLDGFEFDHNDHPFLGG